MSWYAIRFVYLKNNPSHSGLEQNSGLEQTVWPTTME